MTGLRYVYAVCRPLDAPLQAELSGVAGAPAKLLNHHGLVAVLSEVPERDFAEEPLRAHLEDLDWLAATARAHQGVIDALTVVTTPLPMRLATVFRDDSGVRSMIEAREEHFGRTLERLEGRVEWGVKVYIENDRPQEPAQPAPKPVSGRDYLRQRRQQTLAHEDLWQKAENFATRLHDKLSAFAEDSRLHAPQNATISGAAGRNVLNAAYLVPRSHSEEFVELVDRTKDDAPGLRVELTGPWAAYSFAGESQASEGPGESGESAQPAQSAQAGQNAREGA
ncbi:GvpL/GvpF family gas vesicle protein [Streptomyces sp. Li-HN-5-11]|uniref:GvpL/GvpF family gas vesicle protein n=1 Tax=Streptomyces sp. Li-HN-5-11 TaxID=3075432 RepID=UPI0028ADE03D|nr:GvpL/GvpF family gas vesicle protein [Streptomyces sp. Li-HN-5-11]WNM33530.1 GvpL/GvpF family gas vesicle protein [Streptomyces sp. Li-HN-5-11]